MISWDLIYAFLLVKSELAYFHYNRTWMLFSNGKFKFYSEQVLHGREIAVFQFLQIFINIYFLEFLTIHPTPNSYLFVNFE